jgi:hypothetical protein
MSNPIPLGLLFSHPSIGLGWSQKRVHSTVDLPPTGRLLPQIPCRQKFGYGSFEMTERGGCVQQEWLLIGPAFITLGGPTAHDHPGRMASKDGGLPSYQLLGTSGKRVSLAVAGGGKLKIARLRSRMTWVGRRFALKSAIGSEAGCGP